MALRGGIVPIESESIWELVQEDGSQILLMCCSSLTRDHSVTLIFTV